MNLDQNGHRPPWIRIFDVAAVIVFAILLLSLFIRVGAIAQETGRWWIVASALLPGYLIADLSAGLVHWFCDSFFAEDTLLVGKILIRPFREHHRDPHAITRHGFFELNGNNCLAMVPLLLFSWLAGGPGAESSLSLFLHSFIFSLSLAIFATNQFHRWAHTQKPLILISWLQRSNLILNPERHQRHHCEYDRAFCVTSGWMNPLLDAVLFSRRVELLARYLQR